MYQIPLSPQVNPPEILLRNKMENSRPHASLDMMTAKHKHSNVVLQETIWHITSVCLGFPLQRITAAKRRADMVDQTLKNSPNAVDRVH